MSREGFPFLRGVKMDEIKNPPFSKDLCRPRTPMIEVGVIFQHLFGHLRGTNFIHFQHNSPGNPKWRFGRWISFSKGSWWCSAFMLVSWGCMYPLWLFCTHPPFQKTHPQRRHGTHLSVGSPRARAPRDLPLEENFRSLSWNMRNKNWKTLLGSAGGGAAGAVGCGGLHQWK